MTLYKVEDVFEDIPGDPDNVLLKIPEEICEQVGLKEGDTVTVTVTDGQLVIKKHG